MKRTFFSFVVIALTIGFIEANNVKSEKRRIKVQKDSILIIEKNLSNLIIIKNVPGIGINQAVKVNVLENQKPIADAGADKTVAVGSTLFLDASNSYDPMGMTINYKWIIFSKPKESNSSIRDRNKKVCSFSPDVPGQYYLSLKVTTSDNRSANDEVIITAEEKENKMPIANAGDDKNVEVGAKVYLDGTNSYDPLGTELSFEWFFSAKPNNSKEELENRNSKIISFKPDVPGQYYITLIVTTNDNRTSSDEVLITAEENEYVLPVADAGEDKIVETGTIVYLDASNSYDPLGKEISYEWFISAKPKGSNSNILNQNSKICNVKIDKEGEYYVTLIVKTTDNRTSSDEVLITASNNEIINPIVEITENLTTCMNSIVYLDGNNSYDPLGQKIKYLWYFNSKPSNSNSSIVEKEKSICSFKADRVGEYIVTLLVETEDGRKASNSVVIKASVCELIPIASILYESTYCICDNPIVILNGENSTTGRDDYIIYYEWEMKQKPENSKTKLLSYGLSKNHFIPDISGTYKISLIVWTNMGLKSEKVNAYITVFEGAKPSIEIEFNKVKVKSILDEKFIVGITVDLNSENDSCFTTPFKMVVLRNNGEEKYNTIKRYFIPIDYENKKSFHTSFVDSYLNDLEITYMVMIMDNLNNVLIQKYYKVKNEY